MSEKQCKKCGKIMKLRKGTYGDFWGCTGYPDCKTTEPAKVDPRPEGWEKTAEVFGKKTDFGKSEMDMLLEINAKLDIIIRKQGEINTELGGEEY